MLPHLLFLAWGRKPDGAVTPAGRRREAAIGDGRGMGSDVPEPSGLASLDQSARSRGSEPALLTDLLTTDVDDHGYRWTRPPSTIHASRLSQQVRTDLDGRNLATDQKAGAAARRAISGPLTPVRSGQPRLQRSSEYPAQRP